MADVPPALTLELPKKSDLPNTFKPWNEVHLPIDILLLTVDDCEFLACYAYLRNSFKSYLKNLGYVYFGNMGENGDVPLKVALMTCSEGSSAPDGSLVTVKNAVVELRPKAVFYVGCCGGLNPEVTKLQLGDVVVSSKLTTESFKTPVSRDILRLVRPADHGWIPPLRNPEDHKVQVCCNGEILSGINPVSAKQQNVSHFTEATALAFGGEGLFAAAHDLKIEWVIVKGISHFADGTNPAENSWESHACIMAASLVSNMLKDPFVFEQWPHYEDRSARKQLSSSTATKEELPDSLCLEECQRQLRSIYETNNTVKIVPWDQSSAVHIDEIYTQLSWLMDEKKPSGVTQKKLKHYTDIFDGGRLHHTPKRILVHGRPGIGKTVFTQKATFDWSQPRCKGKLGRFDLVLLVKLRDVCDLNDVPAILSNANLLASDGRVATDNLYDYVLHHQQKVLLILDGYDEYVHSAEGQSPVLNIWQKKQLRDCRVIITSRDMKGEGLKSSSDAQFEIDGFDRMRQEEFARRFLKDAQDVEEFFQYLKQQDLKDVAKIPLLLLMLLLVWKDKDGGLPSSRAMIYFQFIETLFDHMSEKQEKPAEKVDDHKQELCKLGELAFDALLQDLLYFPVSKLSDQVLTEKLIEAGLFQLLNMTAHKRCKAVHFIHKSLQEFLASLFLKEELLSQESKNNSLFKVDSIEKIFKLNEVFKFAAEMSEEAAREILIHLLRMAAKEDGEYSFDNQAPSVKDLSETQKNLLTLCTQLFFYCSADTRTELFPNFLSILGGVFLINPEQLNIAAKENFVKSTASLMYIFFSESDQYTEQSYNNLISLVQQLNAVIVSRTGEQKASEFLNVFPWRSVDEFFLMKEENNTHLYFTTIVKDTFSKVIPFPFKMVKTLVSLEETTKKTNMNGDESSEESSSSCCSKRHGLSRVRWIDAGFVNRSEVEQLIEIMPFITAPHVIWVWGEHGELFDAEVTESLLRRIPITHKLERLTLWRINVTSSPAVEFISRVFKQHLPNLKYLNMSYNPLLGAGVDSLIKHLSCAPHLEELNLWEVKMTPQQVMNLTSAVQQHGNNTKLNSSYHDGEGNPKPEHEWPSENFWKSWYPDLFPDSSPESAHEQEQAIPRNRSLLPESPYPTFDSSSESISDSSSESEMELEQNEGEVIESEDGKASYESEENQEQNDGDVIETEDETPSYESEEDEEQEIGNQTAESQVLSTDEDEEGIAESEDETSLPTSEENQQQNDGYVIETEDETPSYESEEDEEQEIGNQTAESQVLSTDEEEEGIAESEDETSLPTSEENQQQDVPEGGACMWPQEPGGKEAPGRPQTSHDDDDDGEGDDQSDSSDNDDDDEDAHGTALEGAYDPTDYEHLHVSQEIKDLFRYITRYTPQTIDVEHKLKPFNRDFIPAVGDIDAFLKVTRPDGKPETLGLVVLDEPIAKQSDPTVLDMTIRTISKQTNVKAMTVGSIEDPEKNPKAVDNSIDRIRELHQQKPAPAVHYQRNMPDIEFLMQEWPEEFEELLKKVGLPTADLDVDLKQYVDLVCGILGIPVHNNRIHALHVLFTLFSEFKNSQHFKQLAKDNQLSNDLRLDSGSGNLYTVGVAAATEHMTLSGEETQTVSFDD